MPHPKNLLAAIVALLAVSSLGSGVAQAEGDLSRADVQEVVMELGSNADGMYFSPHDYRFETGQAYRWVLRNTDSIKHELDIMEMRAMIYTRKIEITDAAGNLVAEIKGDIAEVEVGPGQTVDWYFVPVQTGENIAIECGIAGHSDAGMTGTVTLY